MCYSIYRLTSVMKLCMAANQVQQLIDNGTLAEAFGRNKNGEAHDCIAAFNVLAETSATVADERKDISPTRLFPARPIAPVYVLERIVQDTDTVRHTVTSCGR